MSLLNGDTSNKGFKVRETVLNVKSNWFRTKIRHKAFATKSQPGNDDLSQILHERRPFQHGVHNNGVFTVFRHPGYGVFHLSDIPTNCRSASSIASFISL